MILNKFSLKNFDVKNKRLIKNTLLTYFVKGGATIISLFMLPAYMRFFENPDILGLWFTALSILSWFLVFDLGVGNGLRNYLVQSFEENNQDDIKKYISSAYFIVGALVFAISTIGYIWFGYLDWNKILHVHAKVLSNDTLLSVVRIIFIGIMLQFLLRLISSILMAMQKAALPNFISLISSALLLLFLMMMTSSTITENLKNLSYINLLTSTVPLLLATVIVFRTKMKNFFPKIENYSKLHAKNIMKLGGAFFWIQMMYLIISNTNEFLINGLIGSRFVVDYKIYYSLFSLIGVLFSMALAPVWSEVTGALTRGEIKWIRNIYYKFFKLGLLATIGLIIMIFSIQFIVDIWLKEKTIKINTTYSIIFALSTIMVMWTAIVSSFVNGLGKLKLQFIFLTVGAILNVVISIVLAKLFNVWIVIVIANIFSLLPYCIFQTVWLNQYFMKNHNEVNM
jgi:O-antigen/teichoic acid export membrane protein